MELKFNIDVEGIIAEAEALAISHFKQALSDACTGAFRNAESVLTYADNFHYAWSRCSDAQTKADIGAIVYTWVKDEFRKDVVDYIMEQKDFKVFLEDLKANDELADAVAYKLSNSKAFREKVLSKIQAYNEEEV